MADIKIKYPSADTIPITITLASLANSGTLIAGRSSGVIDNTTNLDLDHLVSGFITTGTSPTAYSSIEIWTYAINKIVSGVPSYPGSIAGTDAAVSFVSVNNKLAALKLLQSFVVDSNSDRTYYIPPTSVAQQFGGVLPPYWGLFVANGSGVALNATGTNHSLQYLRVQAQN